MAENKHGDRQNGVIIQVMEAITQSFKKQTLNIESTDLIIVATLLK